jgi:hypothetical protein
MTREWYEYNGLTYSDLDPRFAGDDEYRRWADSLGGPITIDENLVDLEEPPIPRHSKRTRRVRSSN